MITILTTQDKINLKNDTLLAIEKQTEKIEIKDISQSDFINLIISLKSDPIIKNFKEITPYMVELNESLVFYDLNKTYS